MDDAAAVTGARYVNLSWLEPDGWIRGSAWAFQDAAVLERALEAARYVAPGFDPMAVRFRSDVNGAVRRVLENGRPYFAPFAEHVEGTVHPLIARVAEHTLGLRWTHSVPLRLEGTVVGALAFHWSSRPHPHVLGVAETFSAQIALTLENVRLAEALRARAAEIERSRERIATAAERTRHEVAGTLDRIASRMLVVAQRLLGCRALLGASPAYAAAEVVRVADEVDRLRDEDVRAASHRLHPSLISIGLVPALEMLSDSFVGLDLKVDVSQGVLTLDDIARNALPPGVRLAVYRSVEDAVGDIGRGSASRSGRIELTVSGGALRAAVVDEAGRGAAALPPSTVSAIRDRIESVDGVVDAGGDARGARLTVAVPLRSPPRRHVRDDPGTDLFQRIADNALGVTGARLVSLSWYDAHEGAHELGAIAPLGALARMLAAARRVGPGFDLARLRFPADVNAATRTVLLEGRALLAPTAEHAVGTMPTGVLRAASALLGFRWTYSVPLVVDGAVAGALAFHFADRPAPVDIRVADVFASRAALTLANERLSAALRERAEELADSRDRIAAAEEQVRREIAELLHGRVQSRLLVVAHRLLEAHASLASDPSGMAAALEALALDLDRIREEDLGQAIRQLHPAVVGIGLLVSLRHVAEELEPRLDVTVTADGGVEALDDPARSSIPEPVRLAVYRTVEEALANVARHAGTSAAAVHVELGDGALTVTVSDAGRGYDPNTARDGVGLRSMRDRAERLGGTLAVYTAPGHGTTVTCTLPLELAG